MALNVTSALAALSSMNFTADCFNSVEWLGTQGSQPSIPALAPNDTINVAFLRGILPTEFGLLANETLLEFYDQLIAAEPSVWYDSAVENIQAGCLAPELARSLSFGNLDLTRNCLATATFYSNALCVVNGPEAPSGDLQSGWTVDQLGSSHWMISGPPATPLNSTIGLTMLRNGLPSQYENISDTELAAWASLAIGETANFTNKSQVAHTCEACLTEFCAAAAFAGNPDIAGIGAMISYVMGAVLATVSFIYWLAKETVKWNRRSQSNSPEAPFPPVLSSTVGLLFSGTVALTLSLSLALLVLFARGGDTSMTHSYYEQVMAANASYIASYMLIILGVYYPLSSFKDSKFATTWVVLSYLVKWLEGIGLLGILFHAFVRDGTFQFGDEPCLRTQLGDSPINNPYVYSVLFIIVNALSEVLLEILFVLKALSKYLRLQISRKTTPQDIALSRYERLNLIARQVFGDTEALSIIIVLPISMIGTVLFTLLVTAYFLWYIFTTDLSLEKDLLRELQKRNYNPEFLSRSSWIDSCFEKTSYGAWLLSCLSFLLLWLDIAFMLRVRHAMGVIAGPAWVENQVGFGQILSLVIWLPIIVPLVLILAQQDFESWISMLASKAERFKNAPSDDTEGIELREFRLRLSKRRVKTF